MQPIRAYATAAGNAGPALAALIAAQAITNQQTHYFRSINLASPAGDMQAEIIYSPDGTAGAEVTIWQGVLPAAGNDAIDLRGLFARGALSGTQAYWRVGYLNPGGASPCSATVTAQTSIVR